jgi:mannose-6-phosphate isomerase
MAPSPERPHRLGCNTVPVYYAGGPGIDRFRGEPCATGPEDWVGSLTAFPPFLLPEGADPATGVSRLADGTLLTDVVALDPAAWLGTAFAERGEPGLLVKLLDAGERLPVHAHPSREVARRHLGSRYGKTEGWLVMETEPGAAIWLGFARDVSPEELRAWVDARDADAMLAAMNRLEVAAGETYYLPAGLPHAIGAGVMITELQEPTSFSILAEYAPFGLDEEQATLGLGWELALGCFDLRGHPVDALGELAPPPRELAAGAGWSVEQLFPTAAEPFFQALRVRVGGSWPLGAGAFRILVVERGEGELAGAFGREPVRAGETWLLPAAVDGAELDGELELLACLTGTDSAS